MVLLLLMKDGHLELSLVVLLQIEFLQSIGGVLGHQQQLELSGISLLKRMIRITSMLR